MHGKGSWGKRIGVEMILLVLLLGVWQWVVDGGGVSRKIEECGEMNGNIEAFKEAASENIEEKQNEESGTASGEEQSEESGTESEGDVSEKSEEDYIHWVEFNVSFEALNRAYTYDVETYQEKVHLGWVELLAYLGAKYGGDFRQYKEKDMTEAAEKLLAGETTLQELTKDMKYYPYYREAYGAVLDGMVGEYEREEPVGEGTEESEKKSEKENGQKETAKKKGGTESENGTETTGWKKYYGLKAFGPIAKGFPYSDYDDFGVSRSYGYRRNHLGHDMMGQVGTPVIGVETGYIKVMGWNQYGGWRIGISSFDGKRYYYYAHLRQNIPFAEGLKEGDVVTAGDVIGYMGRTGYSAKENVNNIDTYHLHFGLQLIFDESQREGSGEIWVDVYPLVRFLTQNRSAVLRNDTNKEWYRQYGMKDPAAEKYIADKEDLGK